MELSPTTIQVYHVFLASPGDVAEERQHVHRFFERFNRLAAMLWKVRFEVVDWENYASIGVGRPQEYAKDLKLLKACLDGAGNVKGVRTELHLNGWPADEGTLDDAAAIVIHTTGEAWGSRAGISTRTGSTATCER